MKQASRFALFALAALAACSDSAVAPRSPAIQAPAPSESRGGWKSQLSNMSVQFSFMVDPKKATSIELGAGNVVEIPANSVCDPNTTSYGVGLWDTPCLPAKAPITFTVTAWIDAKGHPQVNFSPDARFVPTADPNDFVTIVFSDKVAATDPAFSILYCRPKNQNAKAACINEALTDPTLVTLRDPLTGQLGRRIKHFSGYNVAAGDVTSGDTWTMSMSIVGMDEGDGSDLLGRLGQSKTSGFMLASGRSQ